MIFEDKNSVIRLLLILLVFAVSTAPAHAEAELKLPRFVSLKAGEVNVRSGPGLRYQIKWVMKRGGLPLEVIAEFEQWRKIRDIEGSEGWLHSSMLSGKRTVMLNGEEQVLKRSEEPDAAPVARMQKGAYAELLECTKDRCRVKAQDIKGWVDRALLWGIYPEEWQE